MNNTSDLLQSLQTAMWRLDMRLKSNEDPDKVMGHMKAVLERALGMGLNLRTIAVGDLDQPANTGIALYGLDEVIKVNKSLSLVRWRWIYGGVEDLISPWGKTVYTDAQELATLQVIGRNDLDELVHAI